MRYFPSILVFVLCIACPKPGDAQQKDFNTWLNVELAKKYNDKLEFSFGEELRLNENSTGLNQFFSELGGKYSFSDYLKIGIHYRYSNSPDNRIKWSTGHQVYLTASYRRWLGPFLTTYQMRVQTRYSDIRTTENGSIPEKHWRHKITAQWDIGKRIEPYAAVEGYYQLDNPDGNEFDKFRYTLGGKYTIDKDNSIGLFIRHQREVHVKNPQYETILGIGFSHDLKKFK